MSLYAWINLLSISIPFLVSFHPSIRLYRHWHLLVLTIALAMIPYIVWDVYFTAQGFWGFNPDYLMGAYLLGLPIEEWLFFICIPYACVFTHYSILRINKDMKIKPAMTQRITIFLLILMSSVGLWNFDLAYTLIDMIFGVVVLLSVQFIKKELLESFYVTFLFMLIPFFIVNGILTGTGIVSEVVWYNDVENLGIRIFSIPIEDIGYAFSLILLNLFLFEKFKRGQDPKPVDQ